MNGWLIYWITRLDAVTCALTVAAVAVTVLIGIRYTVSLIKYADARYDDVVYDKPDAKDRMEQQQGTLNYPSLLKSMLVIACAWLCVSFVPSSKEAAAIYLIPKIANNEQVQKVPEQALRLLNVKLEQWIDDQIGTDPESDTEPNR